MLDLGLRGLDKRRYVLESKTVVKTEGGETVALG